MLKALADMIGVIAFYIIMCVGISYIWKRRVQVWYTIKVHRTGVVKHSKITDYGKAITVAYKIRVGTKYQTFMFTETVPTQINIGAGDIVNILVHPEVYTRACLDTNSVIKKYGYRGRVCKRKLLSWF